ncbi:MAG: cysteinyl-tRNA synthetase, partial [Patescibacteria group bacterium]|nr:cysteinyl-tRNA synthetase [Patescibacteria group bacterium]
MKLYNTKTQQLEEFKPIKDNKVLLYTCGPTVYNSPHIGNWVAFLRWDILVRTLMLNSYNVTRVMNITDVGHLTSDEDEGEDKMQKGARREGITAWDVAKKYTNEFMQGMNDLNCIMPTYITNATDFIEEQITLVTVLEQKGYTYVIDDGVYFDTSKFSRYADFA